MERRLKLFVQRLSERLGQLVQAKVYVDTGPMLDRAVAERAGIGWFGKNTNVLTRSYGSWVFLGQVITDLELEPDAAIEEDLRPMHHLHRQVSYGRTDCAIRPGQHQVHLLPDHRVPRPHTQAPASTGR